MLKDLIAKATKGKLFIRYCDDAYHQCMTVLSTRDWGERNTGVFNDEPDTVAITFHQLGPSVGCEAPNFNEDNARLLVALWNHREAIADLIDAAEEWKAAHTEYMTSPTPVVDKRLTKAEESIYAVVGKLSEDA